MDRWSLQSRQRKEGGSVKDGQRLERNLKKLRYGRIILKFNLLSNFIYKGFLLFHLQVYLLFKFQVYHIISFTSVNEHLQWYSLVSEHFAMTLHTTLCMNTSASCLKMLMRLVDVQWPAPLSLLLQFEAQYKCSVIIIIKNYFCLKRLHLVLCRKMLRWLFVYLSIILPFTSIKKISSSPLQSTKKIWIPSWSQQPRLL